MAYEPIAIVGRACVLPGVLSPAALWDAIVDGRDLVGPPAPSGERIDPSAPGVTQAERAVAVRAASRIGGHVTGFDEVFDPTGFAMPAEHIKTLDPLFQWTLHCGRQAWCEAGGNERMLTERTAAVLANLSYPTRSLVEVAASAWIDEQPWASAQADRPAPENRFVSGYPAHVLARSLGLGGPAFALDAACASSLCALESACAMLHDRTIDAAIVAAVNHSDNLFLHLGFSALNALSASGRSQPFQQGADGLLPSEGAAALVVKRLADVDLSCDRVFGVVRGIGLSNDGARRGLLSPDPDGQREAMENAYRLSDIDPASVSLIECHATGTPTGDPIEARNLAHVFTGADDLPIGSLKSSLGHPITVAGLAGVLKVLGAFEHRTRPPMRDTDNPIAEVAERPLRLLTQAESWDVRGPRRAGVNAFGFGGNNAHLILEEWTPEVSGVRPRGRRPARRVDDVAVCGVGLRLGEAHGVDEVLRQLTSVKSGDVGRQFDELAIDLARARATPTDLQRALAQQLALFDVVDEALDGVVNEPSERVGVFVGMGCDTEAARWGMRWRLDEMVQARLARRPDEAWFARAREAVVDPIDPPSVLGAMPNVPANRLNVRHDWRGVGFTVSSEELSGPHALDVAMRALRAGRIDMAVVAAVDLSVEPAHAAVAEELFTEKRQKPGDAAVALVLKRHPRACGETDPVLAVLPAASSVGAVRKSEVEPVVTERFGHAHAASGLAHLAVEIAARSRRVALNGGACAPWFAAKSARSLSFEMASFSGQRARLDVAFPSPPKPAARVSAPLQVECWAASDTAALSDQIANGHRGRDGPCRLAIVAPNADILEARRQAALTALRNGGEPTGLGIFFRSAPIGGETAVMFTGSAASYPGMARELLAVFPELCDRLGDRFHTADDIARALAVVPDFRSDPFLQLRASTFVCQAHALLAMDLLGVSPTAVLGLSSGETNALFAFDAWRDGDGMLADLNVAGMFSDHLAGQFRSAAAAWGEEGADWRNYRLLAPIEAVQAACADEPRASVSIITGSSDCVIGGDRAACRRVIEQVGRDRTVELGQNLIVHCEELRPFADMWRRLHTRPTHAPDGVRFYSNAHNNAYELTSEAVADALTHQAIHPIDFTRTTEQAWCDGVRVFIECGPRDALTRSVSETLDGHEHLAVSLDRFDRGDFAQVVETAAQLYVAGLDIDLAFLATRGRAIGPKALNSLQASGPTLRVPAHPPSIKLPPPVMAIANDEPRTLAAAPIIRPADWTMAQMAVSANSAPTQVCVMPVPPGSTPTRDRAAARRRDHPPKPTRIFAGDARNALVPVPALSKVSDRRSLVLKEERAPTGPTFDRSALERASRGLISDLFGDAFRRQDHYRRQVRMPAPPLLLADRVTGIEGAPGIHGKGAIWTETDVQAEAWYMHNGRMSPGVVIESGQADLLLISWMGADFLNQDERVYRLLGCELTFHGGGLPQAGDTLRFQISIDGHAQHGDVRLFFFNYDCRIGDRPLMSVRNGQAGFFTDDELANSGGVLWDAATDGPPTDSPRVASLPDASSKRSFTVEEVSALTSGDAFACFGEGFERTASHHRTPRPPGGRLALIDDVPAFDPTGGPWGRGYLRARATTHADAWFYDGHFHNDPCMPGTLMADAATQALALFMAASGMTLDRDGWRFEPAGGEAFKFVCRGQVIPDRDHEITYEVFVDEIGEGPEPIVFASLLATSDELKVFHCPRFGLKLVRDWPRPPLSGDSARIVSPTGDVRGDQAALLASADGRPSDAFGEMYARFDREGRIPRLPVAPYHFMSRIVSVSTPPGTPSDGAQVITEYDPPTDAWFFQERRGGTMPFAALAEVMLQPCGWLASYTGFALAGGLAFRNLDGDDMLIERHVRPGDGPLRVTATLTRWSAMEAMNLVFCEAVCETPAGRIATVRSSFGFFRQEALAQQKGLALSSKGLGLRTMKSDVCDVLPTCADVAGERLRLVDEVTGFWPYGGDAGLGIIRGRQTVNPRAWYFRAHFYEDPVQAGSLGLEALYLLFDEAVRRLGLSERFQSPIVDSPATGRPFAWRYRGQVTPQSREVTTVVELTTVEEDGRGLLITANGTLWVDDTPIYELRDMAMRLGESTA